MQCRQNEGAVRCQLGLVSLEPWMISLLMGDHDDAEVGDNDEKVRGV